MNEKRIEEVWIFDGKNAMLGTSFFIICILVLGLSVNHLKAYAYIVSSIYVAIVLYLFILEYRKIQQALKWEKVSGIIVESKKIIKRCIGNKQGNIYSIDVEYRYTVDEENIYSNAWSFFKCDKSFYTSEEASSFLKKIRPRSEVDVFVNPQNRYESYINKDELLETESSFIEDMILSLFVIIAPLFFIAYFA